MDICGKTFDLTFPVKRQHCGIPLANGDLGVMLFGEGRTFSLELSLTGCWDHRCSERFEQPCSYRELVASNDPFDIAPVNAKLHAAAKPVVPKHTLKTDIWFHGTRVAGGRFNFTVKGDLQSMSLCYETGGVTVCTQAGSFELVLNVMDNAVAIHDENNVIEAVEADPMWNRLSEFFSALGYVPPTLLNEADVTGWYQPLPADTGMVAFVQNCEHGWYVAAEVSDDTDVERVADFDAYWQAVCSVSADWWRSYWQRQPSVVTPDTFINRFFVHALYKFGAATSPNGTKPAGLQGPWLEDYQRPPWSCDYHFNVNEQQIYTLAFATGNLAHLLPMFDMLESEAFQAVMRQNANMMFGIDDGLLMTHAVNDRGWQVGGMGAGATLDFACGGWMGLLYWWYYRYSGDVEFLRKRAMPFMRGVMRVYEEALEDYEGRLSLPLSISAEYGCTFKVKIQGRTVMQNTGRDPSSQLSCIHALTNALLEGCRVLGEEPKAIWQDIKHRLPHLTTIGEGNEKHIAIWEGQDLDVCHRHHSHLSLIYPFDILAELTEEEQGWLTEGIDHWILRGMGQWSEWCYPWAVQLQARRGFQDSPVILLNLWRQIFVNEGMATAYLPRFQGLTAHRRADMLKPKETHEVMQLDGTMAGATAMIELLIHERGGVFHLFPAIPDSWQTVSFEQVRLPGGLTISAKRDCGILSCIVTASRDCSFRIVLKPGDEPLSITMTAGEMRSLA